MALPFFSLLCLHLGLTSAGVFEEGNDDKGHSGHKPHTWTKICLEGKKQSPINIVTSHAVCQENAPALRFDNFDQNGTVLVTNNGETGVVDGFEEWEDRPIFVRSELRLKYYLQQLHFHWNLNDRGSEHAIDGQQATAEMHMVFSLGDMNVSEAKFIEKGLVVVGVLLNVVEDEKLGIYEGLINVKNTSKSFDDYFVDEYFDMSTKLPDSYADYFRYDGSLTTSDCEENVHWIVYRHPLGISQRELDAMRHLHDPDNYIIDHNNRQPMEINGRKVRLYSSDCGFRPAPRPSNRYGLRSPKRQNRRATKRMIRHKSTTKKPYFPKKRKSQKPRPTRNYLPRTY